MTVHPRRPVVVAMVALLLPIAVLLTFVVIRQLFFSEASEGDIVRVTGAPNVRECASTKCSIVDALSNGSGVVILHARTGERLDNSDRWYEVLTAQGHGYIHSRFVANGLGGTAAESFWTTITVLLTFVTALGVMSQRIRRRVSDDPHSDVLLFALVMGAGVSGVVVAYILSTFQRVPMLAFLTDSALNLGCGFVGAALTFALFQVLLSERSLSQKDLAEVKADIEEVTRLVERMSTPRDGAGLQKEGEGSSG